MYFSKLDPMWLRIERSRDSPLGLSSLLSSPQSTLIVCLAILLVPTGLESSSRILFKTRPIRAASKGTKYAALGTSAAPKSRIRKNAGNGEIASRCQVARATWQFSFPVLVAFTCTKQQMCAGSLSAGSEGCPLVLGNSSRKSQPLTSMVAFWALILLAAAQLLSMFSPSVPRSLFISRLPLWLLFIFQRKTASAQFIRSYKVEQNIVYAAALS